LGLPDMPLGPSKPNSRGAEWRTAFPGWETTIQWQIAENDWVATRIAASGTHLGELIYRRFGLIPTTGRPVPNNAALGMRISKGRIVEMAQDGDFLGLLLA
jgi:predicted ester cyclase